MRDGLHIETIEWYHNSERNWYTLDKTDSDGFVKMNSRILVTESEDGEFILSLFDKEHGGPVISAESLDVGMEKFREAFGVYLAVRTLLSCKPKT